MLYALGTPEHARSPVGISDIVSRLLEPQVSRHFTGPFHRVHLWNSGSSGNLNCPAFSNWRDSIGVSHCGCTPTSALRDYVPRKCASKRRLGWICLDRM
jgi:hypothetical protein